MLQIALLIVGVALAVTLMVAVGLTVLYVQSVLELRRLKERFEGVLDADEERTRVLADREAIERERAQLAQGIAKQREKWEREFTSTISELERITKDLDLAKDEAELQTFGIYSPRFSFDSSERFKEAIREVRDRQKQVVKAGGAAVCPIEWTVEGSKAKGRQMTQRQLKLMLRAFNGESDAAIARVTYRKVVVQFTRAALRGGSRATRPWSRCGL